MRSQTWRTSSSSRTSRPSWTPPWPSPSRTWPPPLAKIGQKIARVTKKLVKKWYISHNWTFEYNIFTSFLLSFFLYRYHDYQMMLAKNKVNSSIKYVYCILLVGILCLLSAISYTESLLIWIILCPLLSISSRICSLCCW